MTNTPSISVIVPVYNVERYIKSCVDSILAQTFQYFELILVDDASPDKSVELCQKLYGGNDKIRLVRHEKNLGLGPARNTGMKLARGKYIYFVDSDDFILPDALEKLFNTAERTNAQIVRTAGWYELNKDEAEPVRAEDLKLTWTRYNQEGFIKNDIFFRFEELWKKIALNPAAWYGFYRRDFLEKNQIQFISIICEDVPFHLVVLGLAERFYLLHDAVYVYRIRENSIMTAKDIGKLSRAIHAMVVGSIYTKNFLKRLPDTEETKIWRDSLLMAFFDSFFIRQSTLPFYENLKLTPEMNETVNKALLPIFGDGAPFARYFFNGYHLYRRQAELLAQQNQRLDKLLSVFVHEQAALSEIINALKSDGKRVLLFSTPNHGNLGDQAIVLGEMHVLKKFFPKHDVIEIPHHYLTGERGEILFALGFEKYIRRDDIIFWHGGGNLGNLWVSEENLRRSLTEKFPHNKIVIFPQSICFTDDDAGRMELANSQKIYNAHSDLHLMTRDENSFEFAKKFFPAVKNYLLPDSVTVLQGIVDDVDIERKGVLFVLRRDKEKVRDDATIKRIQEYLSSKNIPFEITDTVIDGKVTAQTREQKVRDVLLKIRGSKLVVTDRFHGVIFSFVTRTPVLAFKSFDTKISSGIKWFENFPSILYAETQDMTRIENFIDKYYSDEKNLSTELNVNVNADKKFFDALNQIFDNGYLKYPPPLHGNSSITAEKTTSEELFRQCLANETFRKNIELLMRIPIQEKDEQNILTTLDFVADKYFYELRDEQPWRPKILDVPTGVDELLASGKSLCRLGDGECILMKGGNISFQEHDDRLAQKLLQILSEPETDCCVGLPRHYWYFRDGNKRREILHANKYYTFSVPPIRKFFAEHCNKTKTYIDACLYSYISNSSLELCAERFTKLKTLFNGRKVLVVAGETVFKNITHDFFDGATHKEILLAPRINAWRHFDEILNKILTYPEDMVVALILGPTATVLAYELSKRGRIAYDIGHLPKDYDAFMKNADRSSDAVVKFVAPD